MVELKRRHIGNVQEALDDVREVIAGLVKKRDERRDAFAAGIQLAMETRFADDAEEVHKLLAKHGVSSRVAEQVVQHGWRADAVLGVRDCGRSDADRRAFRERR